jgi:DegV family protein with EDD domain
LNASETLDGAVLRDALRAGIQRVFSSADHLNRINVFPVPDGDTGTNLAMTLSAVHGALAGARTTHAGALLVLAADAALDGARGNSGAIFAQFLHGIADSAGERASLDAASCAAAFATGARYARDAVVEPREGTLLSVIGEFAAELQRLAAADASQGVPSLLRTALPRLRAALEQTRDILEVLRAAGVVDAGAAGFVALIEGMSAWFETGEIDDTVLPPPEPGEAMAAGGSEGADRFCTECVVSGETVDPRRLREALVVLGSSLVVAGSRRKARIHIHTNDPAKVFEVAAQFGELAGEKADDMHRQALAAHHGRAITAIVTDSGADLPEELLERLDVHVVPARVHFGGRSYLDKVTLSPREFYRELATSGVHPQTSQPPPGDFRRLYAFLASHYQQVVSIALAARVSGTYAAAKGAAERIPGGKVRVLDSRNVSLGQGLLALYAAECALAGYDGARVIAATEAMRTRTWTWGLLAGLDYAVRGGRVPAFVRTLSRALRCSPVLTNHADGRIAPGGAIFGRRDPVAAFARYVARRLRANATYRIAVGHADAEAEGRRLLEALQAAVPAIESAYLTPLGAALGVHGGPGMLVVGAQEYAPPG